MATLPWAIPTGKTVTGTTYIKDTDDYIAATIEDLVDWCNNDSGTYNDYTLTGLRTDFVTISGIQTITGAKTFSSVIAATGGVTGDLTGTASNATTAVTLTGLTSSIAELNKLTGATASTTELNYVTGVTSSIQTQIDGKASLTGATFTGQVKGITPVAAEDLTRKDYVDNSISSLSVSSGTYSPTITATSNVDSAVLLSATYERIGNIVTVFVKVDVNATNTTDNCLVGITLPISSSIVSVDDVIGTAVNANGDAGTIIGDTVSNSARLIIRMSNSTLSVDTPISFQYEIV